MTGPVHAAAVIPAGGAGARMGGGRRKQYMELAGEPLLLRAIRPFLDHPGFEWIVVALPADDMGSPPLFLPDGVTVVAGGATRTDSVRFALDAVPRAANVVLVHDAARPLLSRAVVDRVLESAAAGHATVPAVAVADTLKAAGDDGRVTRTVDRAGLWRAQTPQGFPRHMIDDAYRRAAEEGVTGTDDAALVERAGGTVVLVEGEEGNIKVTRPGDLDLAEAWLAIRGQP